VRDTSEELRLKEFAIFMPLLQSAWESYIRFTDRVMTAAAATIIIFISQIKPSEWKNLQNQWAVAWVFGCAVLSVVLSFGWRVVCLKLYEQEVLGGFARAWPHLHKHLLASNHFVTEAILAKDGFPWRSKVHKYVIGLACGSLMASWILIYVALFGGTVTEIPPAAQNPPRSEQQLVAPAQPQVPPEPVKR
jgi:hypothetical protein